MTEKNEKSIRMPQNFQDMIPRSIFAEADPSILDKKATTFTGMTGSTFNASFFANYGSNSMNIYRNPARRFYDPEITTTAIYLPRNVRQKNRWCRWFFDHDELVGAVLELHAELPYSRAETMVDDPKIKRHTEECFERTNFFTMLPLIDLEFMKIGEVFIHNTWDNNLGMWNHIVIHNPDFIELTTSPFADTECVIELKPDDELRSLVHSTKPEEQQLKKRLPKDVVRRVLTGKNIILDSAEITHIARRSNPYDVRGTSILNRLFRCFVPGTKVRMFDGTTKSIEEIVIGEEVLSLHGERRKVLDKVEYDVDTSVISVKFQNTTNPLVSTPDHKYLIAKKVCSCGCNQELSKHQIIRGFNYIQGHQTKSMNKLGDNKDEFISKSTFIVEKIPIKDAREYYYGIVPINNDIVQSNLSEGSARLIGYYLAEGYMSTVKKGKEAGKISYGFVFGLHELDTWVKDVIDILHYELGIIPNVYINKKKNVTNIIIGKNSDIEIFNNFIRKYVKGNYSNTKELNSNFIFYEKKYQLQTLIGYFRGDGFSFPTGKYCAATTVSEKLANQIQWILIRNKFFAAIRIQSEAKSYYIMNRWCNCKRAYAIYMSGSFAKNFISLCWNIDFTNECKDPTYTKVRELFELGISYNKIAKYFNDKDIKGCNGGKFYASTIKVMLKNGHYAQDTYTYDLNYIEILDDCFYVPIEEINEIQYKGKVHDITIDVNHWWLAGDGIVSSNTLMYEDKLREAQITISDNFIYPLKIFKLGDPAKGWIPDESHQKALASMLQQANFDPNFSLIYHYGLSVDYITVAEKVMKLEKEWQEINDKKMIALGVSKEFMSGSTTYAAANVGLQIQLARYKAKRDLFEVRWIHDKFLRIMAEKNEWYKRDAKEIVGQYRVKRTGEELRQRLIVPKLMWHKKLMMRDDQQFLTFLNNVYAQGKGPISAITLLMSMGLELENELHNKNKQAELQQMIGAYIQTPAQAAPGGAPPGLGAMAKLKDKLKFGKKEAAAEVSANPIENLIEENINLNDVPAEHSKDFIKYGTYNKNIVSREEVLDREASATSDLTNDIIPINNSVWLKNIKSERIPFEINILFTEYDNKLSALSKKYNGNFRKGIIENTQDLMKSLVNTYVQGKLAAYEWTNFLPIYKQYYSEGEELRDYSDIVLSNEFEDWIGKLATMTMDKDKLYRHLRDLATSCFCFGQLKGFQEQGINSVKVGNSLPMDGIRYKISELLDKGGNLATLISPLGEIVLFSPCIEGFDDIEFGNNIDPHITRYRDFVTADINIKNCPIEYEPFIKRYINKFGKYLKKQYDNVVFVQDVVNLDEWGDMYKQKLSNDLKDIKADMRQQAITATLLQEKVKKLGKIPVFKHGSILFISNWIGMEDVPLTEKLIKHVSLDTESLYKNINKTFKNANFDLTDEEINTYRIFGYVEQFSNSAGELIGWKINENKVKTADVDTKLITGKMWDLSGKCANNRQKEPIQVFEENLRFYLDYPQKLNKELFEAFESL